MQFPRRDNAASESERTDDDFEPDFHHAEFRNIRRLHVVFGNANQCGGKSAKRVAQRGSLRHGGHVNHAKRDAHAGADDQRDDNPFVLHQLGIAERGADCERRGDFACKHSMARGNRRA